jgi:hypothetical protein
MNNTGSLLDNHVLTLDQATPGAGPLAPTIDQRLSPRSETYLTLDHNIRTKTDNSFLPIINAQDESSQQYVNDKYVNFTGREQIMPTVVEQTNLKGHDEFHNLSINDARVTTNQTTLYSYSGNAQREHDGSNWWRYEDAPRVTTNQTTLYSYSGDANGNATSHNQMNRVQFTGTTEQYVDEDGNICEYKSPNSGVTNWSQKGDTLVENYFPGSNGVTNVQLDPDEKMGFTLLNADWLDINVNGASSYNQALPNGERFQQVSQDLIGEVMSNPNKVESVDNRQTANYLITNLQENDFSIYQRPHLRNKNNKLDFFIDSNAQDYSGISTQSVKLEPLPKHKLKYNEQNVYTPNEYNPNQTIFHNTIGQPDPTVENPFLFQQKSPDNSAVFMGKGYPGNAIDANKKGNNERILLDTDSLLSSEYLDFFSPNGCLNNQCVY